MKNDNLKKLICEVIGEEMKESDGTSPSSRPKEYDPLVDKQTIGETAYQRSIISSSSHLLNNLGQVKWLDIELPVAFGVSTRRPCIDLVGRDENNRFVLCELKYEEPNGTSPAKSPLDALRQLLGYYFYAIENADRLQKDGIWHENSGADKLDWTLCKDSENVVLVVAANDKYWERWQNYNSKSRKDRWLAMADNIKEIVGKFKGELIIKFYSTPCQENDFTTQANSPANAECKRYTPDSLIGDWEEIEIC